MSVHAHAQLVPPWHHTSGSVGVPIFLPSDHSGTSFGGTGSGWGRKPIDTGRDPMTASNPPQDRPRGGLGPAAPEAMSGRPVLNYADSDSAPGNVDGGLKRSRSPRCVCSKVAPHALHR
jgi:hypothetical protein